MTHLEILLLAFVGAETLALVTLGAALVHQERLLVNTMKWFQSMIEDKLNGK